MHATHSSTKLSSLCTQQQHPRAAPLLHSSSNSGQFRRCSVCVRSGRATSTSSAEPTLEAVLEHVGIEPSLIGTWRQRAPELSCISVRERVEPLLAFLQSDSLALAPGDLRVMLLRCPRLLSFSTQRQVAPVVDFLRADLGFDEQQVASTLKRFPGIMGYGVKSHLVPHCHYLKSLGLSDAELKQLVLTRPQVLGTSIELVITYLRKWLRVERSLVGRLLWSYPLDYSLPRLVMPSDSLAVAAPPDDTMSADEAEEEQEQQGDGDSDGGGEEPRAALGGADGSSSSSSSSAGPSSSSLQQPQQPSEPQQPQQEKKKRGSMPAWGSAEACSWLDIDLRKSSSSSDDEGDGSNSGRSSGSDPDTPPGAGAGGSSQPPPTAA